MVSGVNSLLPSSLGLMVWLIARVYPGVIFIGMGIVRVLVPDPENGIGRDG